MTLGDSSAGGSAFLCGPSLACEGSKQYCRAVEGGFTFPDGGPPPTYSCVAIPPTCGGDKRTCACIEGGGVVPGETCSDSCGDVTVTFRGP